MMDGKPWRLAMVGGGKESLIGAVHRRAAVLDGKGRWEAGCFSRDSKRNMESAAEYGVAAKRSYASITELIRQEFTSSSQRKIDGLVITTPNDSHLTLATAALSAGMPVLCEKPLTRNLDEANALRAVVERTRVPFVVMHNYSGYPMVRQARAMCENGTIGEIQAIRVQYIQGWLRSRLELTGHRQAAWRTDPAVTGVAGCFGDIGSHAFHLACYITNIVPKAISAQLHTFTSGRMVDDYGHALVRCHGGALLSVAASQISHGYANGLRIEIDGTDGALIWAQEDPNRLQWRRNGHPEQVLVAGAQSPDLHVMAQHSCRLPVGHPEGFLEAFANIYGGFYDALTTHYAPDLRGIVECAAAPVPSIDDGWRTMQFIDAAVRSSADNGAWLAL